MRFMTRPDDSVESPGLPGSQSRRSTTSSVTKLRIAEILGVLGALVLPLVGAHFLFYSELKISPSDVGLDFGDLVQRSSPGLLGMLAIVSAVVIGLYSIVMWMNVVFLPFVEGPTSRVVRRVSVAALGLVFVLVLIPPLQVVGAWITTLWLLMTTVLGLAVVVAKRWREMLVGSLIGAPAYMVLGAVSLLLVLPALMDYSNSNPPGSDPSLATLLLLPPALLFLACSYAVLLLPSLLAMAAGSGRTGAGWKLLQSIKRWLTIRRATVAFASFVLVATHATIFGLAFWNAEAIKRGWDAGIFGSAVLDEAIQHAYGLPVSCVAVTQVKPYAGHLPRTAIRLGSRRQADYALVWDRSGAVMVPNDVVQLTPLRRPACVTGP